MRIGATSRLLVVVGDPVHHSLSPVMHNAAIAALGLDAVYVALRVEPQALMPAVRAFEALGIAGNVTVPHKVDITRMLIRLTPAAKLVEAVNTFWPEGGRLVGDNTDVDGVLEAVDRLDAGDRWLVAGTGGAARAVAAAARDCGASLLIQSREPKRAREFAAWARACGVGEARTDDGSAIDVAVNATPLGLGPDDPLPFAEERLDGCRAALDLVYAAGGTTWVRSCRTRGLRAADGRTMLVAQGARAFERFFRDVSAPREIMRAVVDRALQA